MCLAWPGVATRLQPMADASLPWVAKKTGCAPERAREIFETFWRRLRGAARRSWFSHGSLRGCHGLTLMAAPGHLRAANSANAK